MASGVDSPIIHKDSNRLSLLKVQKLFICHGTLQPYKQIGRSSLGHMQSRTKDASSREHDTVEENKLPRYLIAWILL
jgi:hypothetical protein